MVVRTPSLHSVKRGFFPQIHQALPLSKRESQQLLDTITTSFRKNLDKEHPWQPTTAVDGSSTRTSASDRASSRSNTPSISHNVSSRSRPTDQHLRSILGSPFFSHESQGNFVKSGSESGFVAKQLHIFDAAVAKDLMNIQRATGFLVTMRNKMAESKHSSLTKLGSTGAGFHVLQWLRSTNQETKLQFLSDARFVSALVPFLYAEGLEDVAWAWLAQIASPAFAHHELEAGLSKASDQPIAKLFAAMVHEDKPQSSSALLSNLDVSYSTHLRAHQLLSGQTRVAQGILKSSWARLSWQSTVEAWKRPHPSTGLFESFVESGRPLKRQLDLAHLELHHPTDPRSQAALQYMHTDRVLSLHDESSKMKEISRQRVLCLALDAVERLKQAGDTTEASWVEKFLVKACEHFNIGTFDLSRKSSSALPLGRLQRYMTAT